MLPRTKKILQVGHGGQVVMYDAQLKPYYYTLTRRLAGQTYYLPLPPSGRIDWNTNTDVLTQRANLVSPWNSPPPNCGDIDLTPMSQYFIVLSPFATWSIRMDQELSGGEWTGGCG